MGCSDWYLCFFSTLVLVIVCNNSSASKPNSLQKGDDKLVLLHVLFRHGDRTNENTYPTDPYINYTYYPFGPGELTNRGKLREYNIGKELRQQYDCFLDDLYTPYVLEASSTNFNRTKSSLLLALAALYPPKGVELWDRGLNWQPIPFTARDVKDDHILGDPHVNCPRYEQLYQEQLSSSDAAQLNRKYKKLYQYLSDNMGVAITQPKQVYDLYFGLSTEEEWGLVLPEWTKSVWPKDILECAVNEYYINSATPEMRRLSGGRLLRKIVDDSKAKIQGDLKPQGRKIFLYSGHESTVAWLMQALGVFFPHVPPYGAYLTVEVRNVTGVFGFRVLYQDYTADKPRVLKVPGCDEFCAFDKFVASVNDNILKSSDTCSTYKCSEYVGSKIFSPQSKFCRCCESIK